MRSTYEQRFGNEGRPFGDVFIVGMFINSPGHIDYLLILVVPQVQIIYKNHYYNLLSGHIPFHFLM